MSFSEIPNLNATLSEPEEIATNRLGSLSRDQQLRFDPKSRRSLRIAEFLMLLMLLGVAAFVVWLWISTNPAPWSILVLVEIVPVGLSLLMIRFLIEEQQIVRDTLMGEVAQSEGQITWNRSTYVAQTPNRKLRPLGGELNLMPGDYRFYYLPRSGVLLSAERLNTIENQQSKEQLLKVLSESIPFSDAALGLNQQGKLHASQATRLWLDLLERLGLVFILVALVFYGFRQTASTLILVLGVIWLAFVLWRLAPTSFRILKDIRSRQVRHVDGVALKAREIVVGQSPRSYIWIERISFMLKGRGYRAVIAGVSYRAYYASASFTLLSIEPLTTFSS